MKSELSARLNVMDSIRGLLTLQKKSNTLQLDQSQSWGIISANHNHYQNKSARTPSFPRHKLFRRFSISSSMSSSSSRSSKSKAVWHSKESLVHFFTLATADSLVVAECACLLCSLSTDEDESRNWHNVRFG
jgi:hypothetical protein